MQNDFEVQGAREVREAVVQAALVTLATGLVTLGLDYLKKNPPSWLKKYFENEE